MTKKKRRSSCAAGFTLSSLSLILSLSLSLSLYSPLSRLVSYRVISYEISTYDATALRAPPTVIHQELNLFAVDGASALVSDHLNRIHGVHALLDESYRDANRGSAQAGHTVNGDGRLLSFLLEDFIYDVEPFRDDIRRGGGAVGKGKLLLSEVNISQENSLLLLSVVLSC